MNVVEKELLKEMQVNDGFNIIIGVHWLARWLVRATDEEMRRRTNREIFYY